MAETEPKHCIICADSASEKIVNDTGFQKMMDLYWKTIKVDVKPEMNKKFHLCTDCFHSVEKFYQINDVLIYFETKGKELTRNLLSKQVNGIIKWQEHGLKLYPMQTEIVHAYGTSLEPTDDLTKSILDSYQIVEDALDAEDDSDDENPSPRNKSPTKRLKTPNKSKTKKRRKVVRGDSGSESDSGSNFSDDLNKHSDDESSSKRDRRTRRTAASVASNASTDVISLDGKECKICLDKLPSSSALSKHQRQHKVGVDDNKYECRLCSQQFTRAPKLIEHKKTCSNVENINDDDN